MLDDVIVGRGVKCSGVASLTIWSCYANISVFIDGENNRFLKKLMMMI
jgi:hypothetical protein